MKLYNIWLTRRCNLRCKYCYEGEKTSHADFLEDYMENLLSFIQEKSKNEKVINVNFHCGEPLLRFEILKKICNSLNRIEQKVFYSMTTNALLLNQEILDFIIKNKFELSVSVDGIEFAHDLNRIDVKGNGSYKYVIQRLKKVLECEIEPRIRMTVCASTIPYLYEGVKTLKDMGCCNIVAAPDFCDLLWTEQDIEKLKKQLFAIEKKMQDDNFSFTFYDNNPVIKKGRCKGGIEQSCIDVNGDIYPCTFAVDNPQFCIGNIKNGIQDEIVDILTEINQKGNPVCSGCTYEDYCISTRCKLMNQMITGNCLTPSPVICALENLVYQMKKG
ncbi:MAG: 4Fe-4S cluster-binding domain-containing protein [Ruminococcus flavefaciens]|nr:4Fe-4S cluster-binding domain-containing protein [Ruminococcus flavefaciens]